MANIEKTMMESDWACLCTQKIWYLPDPFERFFWLKAKKHVSSLLAWKIYYEEEGLK